MSDISSQRIEPTPRVIEPQGPNPRGQSDSGSRRRPHPAPEKAELEENAEAPVHQVDRRV
jgi:hypothetical protein